MKRLMGALALWGLFEYTIAECLVFGAAQYTLEALLVSGILLYYLGTYKSCLPRLSAMRNVLPAYLFLALTLIPLGYMLGFIKFSPRWLKALNIFAIYLFVAIPEELMWRGVVQTFFEKYLQPKYSALIVASVLFGFIHIHKGGHFPNYSYVLLATFAGSAYGYVYKKYGLTESIILHTLVDTTWHTLFL